MTKPTKEQQAARESARKQLLFDAAKAGNKKAQALITVKGGKGK